MFVATKRRQEKYGKMQDDTVAVAAVLLLSSSINHMIPHLRNYCQHSVTVHAVFPKESGSSDLLGS
jgi:hypothetical protein